MHVVSWETNKTRFSKNTSPQRGENQNCPTWVRSPLSTSNILHYCLDTLTAIHRIAAQKQRKWLVIGRRAKEDRDVRDVCRG